jgi:hypothetical protein
MELDRIIEIEFRTYFHNISMIFPYTMELDRIIEIEYPTYFPDISMIFPYYGIGQNHRN